MLTSHHLLLVFLANSVFADCIDTEQTKTYENSTLLHNSKRSGTEKTNYIIPYYGEILYSMYEGKDILIEGWAHMLSKRFIIELCTRDDCTRDIPMQMTARPNKGKVDLSYKVDSVQGPGSSISTSAFDKRPDFQIKFKIQNGIKIYINGVYLTDYGAGRVNKESLRYLSVRGEVFVNWILYGIKNPVSNSSFSTFCTITT
ncbi:uncharacterized protein LOC131941525 [Physella acuta]|uniref:uncharacterized protein LOC131941525 n=1 Tax=Physella acuta TaxID=109671 RepID=UPI0027DC3EAD|nr:uncharacterized protein LOC131941525 [Physella acuta]